MLIRILPLLWLLTVLVVPWPSGRLAEPGVVWRDMWGGPPAIKLLLLWLSLRVALRDLSVLLGLLGIALRHLPVAAVHAALVSILTH